MFLFQAERERKAAEKKTAKFEKLRKFVTEGESKHEFHDPKYDQDREAATDRVHSAVEQVNTLCVWTVIAQEPLNLVAQESDIMLRLKELY